MAPGGDEGTTIISHELGQAAHKAARGEESGQSQPQRKPPDTQSRSTTQSTHTVGPAYRLNYRSGCSLHAQPTTSGCYAGTTSVCLPPPPGHREELLARIGVCA